MGLPTSRFGLDQQHQGPISLGFSHWFDRVRLLAPGLARLANPRNSVGGDRPDYALVAIRVEPPEPASGKTETIIADLGEIHGMVRLGGEQLLGLRGGLEQLETRHRG